MELLPTQPVGDEPDPDEGAAVRPARRLRRWAGNLTLLMVSGSLALLGAEGAVRFFLPQQPILLRPDIWQPHDGLGWTQAPHLDTRLNTGEREVRLLTDDYGHRIGSASPPDPTFRILALGDSYQAALQVEVEDTFTALIEHGLTRQLDEPVEVVNAAVGGWGPSHYLIKARHELARRPYDAVVVFFYLGNDVEPKRIERFGPRQSTVRHAFRWPQSLARRELIASLLYPINDVLETRSHLFQLFKKRLWFVLMRLNLSARHFPSALLRAEGDSDRWQITADVCRSIAEEAETESIPILFVLLPGICEVDPDIAALTARAVGHSVDAIDPDQPSRRMAEELTERGLEVLDTTPLLRAAHNAGETDLYGEVDIHFSHRAHELVAESVTRHFVERLASAPPRQDLAAIDKVNQ